MTTTLTHDEAAQLEMLQRFWRLHGKKIVLLILAVALIVGGYHFWSRQRTELLETASSQFSALQADLRKGDTEAASSKAKLLMDSFGRTPYAALAAFSMSQIAVQAGNLAEARAHLTKIVEGGYRPEWKAVATVRLARLLIADGQADAALILLKTPAVESFVPLYAELRGDIHFAKQDIPQARESYQEALKEAAKTGTESPLLRLKAEQVGAVSDL